MTQELTNVEKQFLALALQGLMLRQGPVTFSFGLSIADKLGIEDELMSNLQGWLNHNDKQEEKSDQDLKTS